MRFATPTIPRRPVRCSAKAVMCDCAGAKLPPPTRGAREHGWTRHPCRTAPRPTAHTRRRNGCLRRGTHGFPAATNNLNPACRTTGWAEAPADRFPPGWSSLEPSAGVPTKAAKSLPFFAASVGTVTVSPGAQMTRPHRPCRYRYRPLSFEEACSCISV